jgi:hypothetical protein
MNALSSPGIAYEEDVGVAADFDAVGEGFGDAAEEEEGDGFFDVGEAVDGGGDGVDEFAVDERVLGEFADLVFFFGGDFDTVGFAFRDFEVIGGKEGGEGGGFSAGAGGAVLGGAEDADDAAGVARSGDVDEVFVKDAVESAGEGAGWEFFGFFLEADFLPVDEFGSFLDKVKGTFTKAGLVGAEKRWGELFALLHDE